LAVMVPSKSKAAMRRSPTGHHPTAGEPPDGRTEGGWGSTRGHDQDRGAGVGSVRRPRRPEGCARMLEEFKKFIMKGNLIAIAVGLIIALKFTDVVNAFVDGII